MNGKESSCEENIYGLFSEEVKEQVGEAELKEQIQGWLDSFDENVNLEYGAYSESNATGSDKYADEEDVIFTIQLTVWNTSVRLVQSELQNNRKIMLVSGIF